MVLLLLLLSALFADGGLETEDVDALALVLRALLAGGVEVVLVRRRSVLVELEVEALVDAVADLLYELFRRLVVDA